ncbi:MAG: DegT/DnrJ/EryC1/StrS family aminotransferase [Deltaproteobacteria bacterium]|nr:DegT/DnrJ/EryC1/StrS family aminotransferase [Deltaproteobacteria bacterium]
MIKLLLSPEVVSEYFHGRDDRITHLIENFLKNPDIHIWIMMHTVTELMRDHGKPKEVNQFFKDFPKIPLNDQLANLAVEMEIEFEAALSVVSAAAFKLNAVVTLNPATTIGSVSHISVEDAEKIGDIKADGPINFLELSNALNPIYNKLDGWFTEIIQSTAFAGGNHVKEFEKEFAEYCGAKHAVAVNSGTDALRFALTAMGIGPGDEVITVPNTFIATTEAISQVGAKTVFVDVSPETYNIEPDLIEKKITPNTKAILPVHLYGQLAEMDRIVKIADKHGLKVLEDACQAHGAISNKKRAGTFGNAAAFSMYPGKNLGAFGEAGCIITNDDEIANIASCLRDHGQSEKYVHRMEGYNGRMDNLQAASLRAKLPLLDQWNQNRREIAALYLEKLKRVRGVKLPKVKDVKAHVFHLFVILVDQPKELHEYLKGKKIFTGFHYPIPLHLQEAYQSLGHRLGDFPVTEELADSLISLPMFPEMNEAQVNRICEEIKRFYD